MNLNSNILTLINHKKPPNLTIDIGLSDSPYMIPRRLTFSGHFGLKTPYFTETTKIYVL